MSAEKKLLEKAFNDARKQISMLGEKEVQMTDYLIQPKYKTFEDWYAKQSKQEEVNYQKMFANCKLPNEKPQPQEKVDVEKILHQVYDAGVRNVDCDLTTHYEQIKNTLQDTKIREAAEEWNKYKSFLQEKYPVEEGEEWQFTCEQHQKIDEILNSKKH